MLFPWSNVHNKPTSGRFFTSFPTFSPDEMKRAEPGPRRGARRASDGPSTRPPGLPTGRVGLRELRASPSLPRPLPRRRSSVDETLGLPLLPHPPPGSWSGQSPIWEEKAGCVQLRLWNLPPGAAASSREWAPHLPDPKGGPPWSRCTGTAGEAAPPRDPASQPLSAREVTPHQPQPCLRSLHPGGGGGTAHPTPALSGGTCMVTTPLWPAKCSALSLGSSSRTHHWTPAVWPAQSGGPPTPRGISELQL